MVIVTSGGRDLAWKPAVVEAAIKEAAGGQAVLQLLHGGARGADALVDRAARRLGWPVVAVSAEWDRYRQAAGPIRNRKMLEAAVMAAAAVEGDVLVLGFPGGAGTRDCLRYAQLLRRSGKSVRVERLH